ncbi:hypothetical protein [Paroceanicella profunda]|uniref:hypothetical protein n=1 Tax=Paroceanicella profunda TaxID=2579971 RepID=UPI001479822B|nr:hypothetical protein [Paroceanicella profunda]
MELVRGAREWDETHLGFGNVRRLPETGPDGTTFLLPPGVPLRALIDRVVRARRPHLDVTCLEGDGSPELLQGSDAVVALILLGWTRKMDEIAPEGRASLCWYIDGPWLGIVWRETGAADMPEDRGMASPDHLSAGILGARLWEDSGAQSYQAELHLPSRIWRRRPGL